MAGIGVALMQPVLGLFRASQLLPINSLHTDVTLECPALSFNCYSGISLRLNVFNRSSFMRISAVGSGLEASISNPKDDVISIRNVEIVVESKDEEKMQVRVDLPGKETLIVFEKILRNLARTAPPVPGFRREKGGKTTKVPKDFLLQILGEDRVTNFVVQEIVTTTIANYVKKENLVVKDNKINTVQTSEQLKSTFNPGNDFGFNAILEFEETSQNSDT